jgi:hypothetical protein
MWRLVALIRTEDSDADIASITKVTRIGQLETKHVPRSVLRLLVTDNVVPSSSIPANMMMETTRSSETSVLTTAITI